MKITVVRSSKETGVFAVRDLAPGGARLVGELDVFEGERIHLEFDGMQVAADVTTVDRQRKVVEVVFRDVPAEALARIQAAIAEVLASVQPAAPTVLIVHPDVTVSSALERDLAKVGVAARVVGTIEEARLDGITGAIVAGAFGEALGPFLEELEKANIKRIILFGDQIKKIEHPAAGRVDQVLRTPWRWKGLARALDLPSDDVVTTYDQLVALKPK
jgi:hypothetical protein